MGTNYIWIDDSSLLARELDPIRSGPVAVDLEADSFHSFREKTCLIQFTFGERHLLIDPLSGLDTGPLGRILADPSIEKVFHGSDYDLRLLHRDFGYRVQGLFDTMIAARLAGETAFGLAALLDRFVGVALDKRHQRADWSMRPLPAEMLEYAVNDTAHLFRLSGLLRDRLKELGRMEWAGEEFAFLETVEWSGPQDEDVAFLKVKRSNRLDPQGLALLRELFRFRDGRAQKKDVPRFRVLRDQVLLDLVRARPSTPDELDRVPGMPRPFTGGSGLGRALIHAVEKGVQSDPFNRPPAPPSGRRRMEPEQEKRLQVFLDGRNKIAAGLELESSLLGSRKLLTALLMKKETGEDWTSVDGLRRWQQSLLAPLLG